MPSSHTCSFAFSFQLLDWFRALSLCGKLASDAFIRALTKIHSSVEYSKTYPHFTTAYRHYRNNCFKIDSLKIGELNLFNHCPACPGPEDSEDFFYVTIDGNYRLCRKSNRGNEFNFREPEINHFFVPNVSSDKDGDILRDGCGITTEAGKTVAGRYQNTDVSGIVMASCSKHEFILKCSNLVKGERNIDIDNLLGPIFHNRRNGILYYDIVCKYGPGAKVFN